MLRSPRAGFSLLELIIVIVVLAVAAAALSTAFLVSTNSLGANEDVLLTHRHAAECADHIVGKARKPGSFAALAKSGTECDALPALPGGITRTLTCRVSAAVTGAVCTGPALSTGAGFPCGGALWPCLQFTVAVTRNGYSASVDVMLIDY